MSRRRTHEIGWVLLFQCAGQSGFWLSLPNASRRACNARWNGEVEETKRWPTVGHWFWMTSQCSVLSWSLPFWRCRIFLNAPSASSWHWTRGRCSTWNVFSENLWWVASLFARDPIPPPRGHRLALDSVSFIVDTIRAWMKWKKSSSSSSRLCLRARGVTLRQHRRGRMENTQNVRSVLPLNIFNGLCPLWQTRDSNEKLRRALLRSRDCGALRRLPLVASTLHVGSSTDRHMCESRGNISSTLVEEEWDNAQKYKSLRRTRAPSRRWNRRWYDEIQTSLSTPAEIGDVEGISPVHGTATCACGTSGSTWETETNERVEFPKVTLTWVGMRLCQAYRLAVSVPSCSGVRRIRWKYDRLLYGATSVDRSPCNVQRAPPDSCWTELRIALPQKTRSRTPNRAIRSRHRALKSHTGETSATIWTVRTLEPDEGKHMTESRTETNCCRRAKNADPTRTTIAWSQWQKLVRNCRLEATAQVRHTTIQEPWRGWGRDTFFSAWCD